MNKIVSLILIVICLFSFSELKASHAMGADLTYECLGGDQYRITLAFYRDCSGISAPIDVSLILTSTCGDNVTTTLTRVSLTGAEISPVCPTINTRCSGGTYTGVQKWEYERVTTLPSDCDEWIFAFEGANNFSGRSGAISTIYNPGNTYLYVESYLNVNLAPCNNSPTFSNDPVPFICIGQEFCFNHGATDSDGDSISYELITPMTSANTTVQYLNSYSNLDPLVTTTGLAFNEVTGDLCMTPSMAQASVMGVLVKEYRNGQLIGSVIRDMQLNTETCTNNNPYVTGVDGSGQFSTTACVGQTVSFDIPSVDDDADDILTLTWDNGITGATVTPDEANQPVGAFNWDTSVGGITAGNYTFTVTIEDDNCPYKGLQTYGFTLELTEMTVDLGVDLNINCDTSTVLTPTITPGGLTTSNLWTTGETSNSITVSPGTFSVTVTSTNGCVITDEIIVGNSNGPVIAFTNGTGCVGQQISLTDNSTSNDGSAMSDWTWFVDGVQEGIGSTINYTPFTDGAKMVKLIAETGVGCIDSVEQNVDVKPSPVAAYPTMTGCLNRSVDFTESSTISSGSVDSFKWVFPDASESTDQTPSFVFANPGANNVKLVVTSDLGCQDSITQINTIYNSPTADFTAFPVCGTADTLIQDLSSIGDAAITTYEWTIEGSLDNTVGDYRYTFLGTGVIPAQLIIKDANSCADTSLQNFTVGEIPVPSFVITSYCENEVFNLNGVGTIGEVTVLAYEWNINGTIDNNQSTTTSFTGDGSFPIQLKVTTSLGCADSVNQSVTINDTPIADFTADPVCMGGANIFTDVSSVSSGTIKSWLWGFDGQGSDNQQSSSFTFPTVGSYDVQLTVESDQGCSKDTTISATVESIPVPGFSVADICALDDNSFINSSSIVSGFITSYDWKVNEVSDDSQLNYTMNNVPEGTFDVELIVASNSGCSDSLTQSFTAHPNPISAFNVNEVCEDDLLQFFSAASISSGTITNYLWDFDDNNTTSLEMNPSHQYLDPRVYSVELTVTSDQNCKASLIQSVTVHERPVPAIDADDVCSLSEAEFEDDSEVNSGINLNTLWKVNDVAVSNNEIYSTTLSAFGTFTIELISYSDFGCADSVESIITVHPLPEIEFTSDFTNGCSPLCVNFQNTFTIGSGTVDFYEMDVEANQNFTNEPASYCYPDSGSFDVHIYAVSNEGCRKDSLTENYINVYSTPEPEISINSHLKNIYDPIFEFTSLTEYADSVLWSLGNGASSNQEMFSYNYVDTGTFDITLVGWNVFGCIDSTFDQVRIEPIYSMFIPTAFTPNDDGVNDTWLPVSYAVNEYELLIYDRWGENIFTSDDPYEAWNGRKKGTGQIAQVDVYVYKIVLVDDLGEEHKYVGRISLVK